MIARRTTGFVAVLLLCMSLQARAETSPADENVRKPIGSYEIPGLKNTFNYSTVSQGGQDVVGFMEVLAEPKIGDLNLAISPRVQGKVNLSVKHVTVGDALEIALAANSLAYEVRGTGTSAIISIMTDEEYKALYGVGFYEQRNMKIVELKYAKPSRLAQMLDGVKSDIGRTIFDDTSGTVVLIDTPECIRRMESIIAKAEIPTIERQLPTITRVFNLRYADTADLVTQIQSSLTKEVGTVTANMERRAIVVTDLPHVIEKIAQMVDVFDAKPKQVAILAKVVEVNLNDQFSLGVDWNHVMNNMSPRYSLKSSVPMSAASLGANQQSPPTLTYRTIAAGGDLEAIVDAMKSFGETKIISNPYISVLDGHEASIQVVENQPYKEIAYEPGTTNVVGVSFSFVDIGTTLKVSPKITDDDFITVSIKPTISSIAEWYAGRPQEGTPVVKKSEAETTVVVRDNVTIIIGGMIKTRNEQRRSGVPLLSSVPLLGALFRSTAEQQVKSETIVFLTPKIITGDEPFLQRPDLEKQPKFRMRRHQTAAARQGRPVLKTRGTDQDLEKKGE